MRFKKPKHGHFFVYCYECKHWTYTHSRGVANLGICSAIKEEPTIQDAYDPPCGMWRARKNGEIL